MNIIEDNNIKLEKFKTISPNPSYIAGLIDGDGCIFIRKIKDGYNSGINITQSRTNILQIMQYHYGGKINKPSIINTTDIFNEDGFYDINNKRNSYSLVINSNEYDFIINDIKNHIILKQTQIDCLDKFKNLANKQNLKKEKEELYITCSFANTREKPAVYDFTRLNIEYIKGLFDAEGYIFVSYKKDEDNNIKFTKSVMMKITQKNHPEIITEIYKFLGFGKTTEYYYYVDTFEDCMRLTQLIKDGLIIKYNQICAFEEYLNTKIEKSEKYDNEIHLKRYNLYKIINMEKHQIEVFTQIKKEPFGLLEKQIEKSKIDIEIKNAKKIELSKLKSIQMSGKNHFNFGNHLTTEHALSISIATTKNKRQNNENLTDEKIKEIYALKDTNVLQKDVAEQYNMNREMIRRIWNRLILPTDDPEFIQLKKEKVTAKTLEKLTSEDPSSSSSLTFEQKRSIGKRSLSIDDYITILTWKKRQQAGELLNGKKITSPKLSEYLTTILNKPISSDIIKCTWNGKTKLFEFEFVDKEISYEEYQKIINN